jgi:ribosomal protein L29
VVESVGLLFIRLSKMQRVKAHELRKKDEKALTDELTKQRKDLAALRVSKVSSQPQVKLSKIRVSTDLLHQLLLIGCEKGYRQSAHHPQREENLRCP